MTEAHELPAVLWPSVGQEQVLDMAIGPEMLVAETFATWAAGVDLSGYFEMATFRLLPLIYRRLQVQRVAHPMMGLLSGVHRKAWCEAQTLAYAMRPVLQALEAAGVRTLLIKGAALQRAYYGSAAVRPMSDLDIVVQPAQALAARAVLEGLGWFANETAREEDTVYRHSMMFRDGEGHELDLHWHLMREACRIEASADFWSHALPLDYAGVPTLRLGHADMLVHTLIHGLRANRVPPLRWIADAMTVIRVAGPALDWDRVLACAERLRLGARLHLGLAYLVRRFDAPVPQHVLTALGRRRTSWVEHVENSVVLRDADLLYANLLTKPWVMFVEYARVAPQGGLVRFALGFTHYIRYRARARGRLEVVADGLRGLARRAGRAVLQR